MFRFKKYVLILTLFVVSLMKMYSEGVNEIYKYQEVYFHTGHVYSFDYWGRDYCSDLTIKGKFYKDNDKYYVKKGDKIEIITHHYSGKFNSDNNDELTSYLYINDTEYYEDRRDNDDYDEEEPISTFYTVNGDITIKYSLEGPHSEEKDIETIEQKILIDDSYPEIKVEQTELYPKGNFDSQNWYKYVYYKVSIYDPHLIGGKIYIGSKEEAITSNNFSKTYYLGSTGTYPICIIAEDYFGQSIQKPVTYKIDSTEPSLTKNKILLSQNDSKNKISNISIDYSVEDKHSGLDYSTVYVMEKKIDCELKKASCNIYNFENYRDELHTYFFKINANDKVSNKMKEYNSSCYNIPPYITLSKYKTYAEDKKIKTEILFNNYDSNNWKYYYNMKLQRFIYLPGNKNYIQITKENFSKYFTKELEKDFINFINPIEITEKDIDSNGNYTDIISEDNPFGHITTGYQLSWEITDLPGVSEYSDVLLIQPTANRQGELELRIRGKNNTYKYISFNKDGTVIYKNDNDNFEMPQNGCVYIAYRLKNQDIEPFDIEMREIVPLGENQDNVISVGIEGFKEYRINQYCKTIDSSGNRIDTFMVTDEIPYPCSNNFDENESWNEFDKPLYLYFNKPTQLMVYLNEGYLYGKGSNNYYGQEAFKSKEIILKAEPPKMDGEDCTLSVGENAGYNYDGITAKPFEPVDLRIESTNSNNKISPSNIIWDFGDGCNQNEPVVSVKHYWPQSELRKDDTSEYLMKITINDKENPINVHIVDTQYGEPYGDEVWRGNHKILNTITIPNTRTLKIGDDKQYDSTILCIGDNCEDYKAQIIIEKGANLIINNSDEQVKFIESYNSTNGYIAAKEMTYGWKGIYLKEESSFIGQNFEILFADRAITLENDVYEFNLKNVVIDSGKIGLHIFDNNNLIINDCVISNNIVYGIKEDFINKNSMDEKLSIGYNITNLIFEGNTIDWYERNNGILTQEEINNKIQGE